jgi:NAD(P)-dependent dehydrogenase (short-subunit alcohol dehydrogenase family)
MISSQLRGKVVAYIGSGTEADRHAIVTFAEAGADLALGTQSRDPAEEFAMNSIANEAWAVGRDFIVVSLDSLDPAAVQSFAEQAFDRYGRCDIAIAAHDRLSAVDLDELSPGEFHDVLETNLVGPFLAAQAFGRLMERAGDGLILFLQPEPRSADAAYRAARRAITAVAESMNNAWRARGVTVGVVSLADAERATPGHALMRWASEP